MKQKVIELKAGDCVRAAGWLGTYENCTAEVGTVRAYAQKYGDNVDKCIQRSIDNGHALAYTMFGGFCLVGDRKLAEAMHRERVAQRAVAITLHDGQHVEIDGQEYIVVIGKANQKQPYNSDPIHFRTPEQVEARQAELECSMQWRNDNGYPENI